MKVTLGSKQLNIPSIPQLGDYSHSLDYSCECHCDDDFTTRLSKWHCDGLYDSKYGMLICFTCNDCGSKFCFHTKNSLEIYAALGVFDEYVVK